MTTGCLIALFLRLWAGASLPLLWEKLYLWDHSEASLSLSSPLPGMDEDEVTAAVPDGIPPCQETKMHPAWKR